MKLKRFDLGTVKDIALELVYPYHCRLERAFKHGIHHMDMGRRSGLRRRRPWLHNEGHSSAVDAAFRSADLALEGIAIEHIHGINAKTPELTMRNK